jgi:ADP-ribose pyrophosphatase YjhB (NUDIX family)
MKESAGTAIIWNSKMLVVHPTNAPWFRTYTPPKGKIEKGENHLQAAIRETFEEIGIRFKRKDLLSPVEVPYLDPTGKQYKNVTLFPVVIHSLEEIGAKSEKLPLTQLQLAEIDEARFMTTEELKDRVLPRYYVHLKAIIEKYAHRTPELRIG